jgi:hypothetical protein
MVKNTKMRGADKGGGGKSVAYIPKKPYIMIPESALSYAAPFETHPWLNW